MRILHIITGALLAFVPALFIAGPAAAAPQAPQACFKLPYFGPWGHADFDFGADLVKILHANGLHLEGIAPVKVKKADSGIYMPIGWEPDHIDPCRGVYYPGGFRIVHEESGREAILEEFWLRADGVHFNVTLDGKKNQELIGTYKLLEFMPTILTPRPFEGGIGPRYWPFYIGPGLVKVLKHLTGTTLPEGAYLGNLDAVVKFVP